MNETGENCKNGIRTSSYKVPYKATCQIEMLEKLLNIFVKIHQSPPAVLGLLDNEKLKRYFQIASSIENAMNHFENIGESQMNTSIVQTMLMDKKLPHYYDFSFFKKSCDQLLSKFFHCNESFLFKTEVAVRIYTSMLPPKRFEIFLSDLLLKSASYKAIEEFLVMNESLDIKALQHKLIMHEWISEFKEDGYEGLTSVIHDMMSPYKVEKSLHILIGIIAFKTESTDESIVRTIVIKEILDKMFCRSILSKQFWLTMLEIDSNVIQMACILSEEFHISLCNFLIFVGSMMDMKREGGQTKWVPNLKTSIYPEITYDCLLKILQYLTNDNFSKKHVSKRKILSAEEMTNCPLWIHFLIIL